MQVFELPANLRNVLLTRTASWSEGKMPKAHKKSVVQFKEPDYPKGTVVAKIDSRTKMFIRPNKMLTGYEKFRKMNSDRKAMGKSPMKKLRVIK